MLGISEEQFQVLGPWSLVRHEGFMMRYDAMGQNSRLSLKNRASVNDLEISKRQEALTSQ